jgi:hypothetical protein
MILEGSDSSFGGIDRVIVRFYQLVGGAAFGDGAVYCSGAFIVQDIKVWLAASGGEGFVQGFVGPEGFVVAPSLHWLRQNDVRIKVLQNEEIFVSGSRGDRESPGWVGIDDSILGVNHMVCGEYRIWPLLDRASAGGLAGPLLGWAPAGFRGADISALAIEMSLGCGEGFWEVAADRFCGEAGPRDELIFSDGVDERGRHWAEGAGMQELHQLAFGAAGVGAEAIVGGVVGARLVSRGWRGKGHEPEPRDGVTVALEDEAVIAPDFTSCARESDVVSVIAEFADWK